VTDEASQKPLDFEKASEELFDPTKDPFLKKGRVSAAYKATPEQIADADRKLKQRRQRSTWTMFQSEDAEPLIKVLEKLIEDAKRVLGETAATATDGADGVAAGGQEDRLGPAPEEVTAIIDAIRDRRAAWKALPFYPDSRLIHIGANWRTGAKRLVFMKGYTQGTLLDGRSEPIHDLNEAISLKLDDDSVEEYVAFFTEHVHGDGGPFLVIEEDEPQAEAFPDNLTVRTHDPREGEKLREKVAEFLKREQVTPDRRYVERPFRAEIGWPLTRVPEDNTSDKTCWVVLGTVFYSSQLFRVAFKVESDGPIDMLAEQLLSEQVFTPIQLAWPRGPIGDSNRFSA